ncbi:MAG: preprotein translocase subunit YajC [Ferrovum sp. 37-45-19]|nr:MAG: preprotein translocase subunit YajC [Ferrovum sp. 21-44-67]OYV95583.1 MAG: preprotein translocase subunit YajC [Ferrovum sp. 37-45-19]OZB31622.1 MAG: preprotein translocase subunit YajC [Ferrovum sp. 34-44-207]
MNVIFIFVMFAVLYFMMIRPQMKRQKELKAMLSALAKGDEVMVSGLVGKITEIDDNYVRLEIAKGVVVQVQRAAVSILLPKGTFKS